MFLDADDILGPTVLEALATEVERHPGSVAACPWYRLDLRGGRWVRRPPSCAPRRPGQDPLDAWLRGWYHPPCAVLWSREAYEQTGGWDSRAEVNNDGDLMMRALVNRVPLRLTTEGEAFYRRLPEGEVSLSGTRFTERGLRARVWVVTRIAKRLREQGRLAPYRDALGEAFGLLEIDCGARHPELAALCRTRRRQYGEAMWKRVARGLQRRTRAAVLRRWGALPRSDSKDAEAGAPTALEEIRYGLSVRSESRSLP
jgi:hypothetical protein